MTRTRSFPLRGIIGVVANGAAEIDLALASGLQCIELRADLLLNCGHSIDDVIAMMNRASSAQLATLLTLRHPTHGGKFTGTEQERVAINRQALTAGADIIDLEWQTEAAETMLAERVPMILSHHDFTSMPDASELARITTSMSDAQPAAIKVVPTAATTTDSLRMLSWVAEADTDIARIGFAMGAAGSSSRLLTTAYGAPITYTSFGAAVAPGQIELEKLQGLYRITGITQKTSIVAVAADETVREKLVAELNLQFQTDREDTVAVGFSADAVEVLQSYKQSLRIRDIRTG